MTRSRIWETLRETTVGSTVTVRIPRELAEELLVALTTGLESEDDDMIALDLDDMDDEGDDDGDQLDHDAMDMVLFGDDDDDDHEGPADDDDRDDDDDEKDEAYMGFDRLKGKPAHQGAEDPGALAASIGRKKYGKAKFQHAAAKGKKLG